MKNRKPTSLIFDLIASAVAVMGLVFASRAVQDNVMLLRDSMSNLFAKLAM